MFLVDCGSTVNIIHKKVLADFVKYSQPKSKIRTLGGSPVSLQGLLKNVTISKGVATIGKTTFLVTDASMPKFHGILGKPFLKQIGSIINLRQDRLDLPLYRIPFVNYVDPKMFCGFSEEIIEECNEENSFWCNNDSVKETPIRIHSAAFQYFPSMSAGYIKVYVPQSFIEKDILIEPAQLKQGITIGGVVIKSDQKARAVLPVLNSAPFDIKIRRGDFIIYGQELVNNNYLFALDELEEEIQNEIQLQTEFKGDLAEQSGASEVRRESLGRKEDSCKVSPLAIEKEDSCKRASLTVSDCKRASLVTNADEKVQHLEESGCKRASLTSKIREYDTNSCKRNVSFSNENLFNQKPRVFLTWNEKVKQKSFVKGNQQTKLPEKDEMAELEKYQLERLPSEQNEKVSPEQKKRLIISLLEKSDCPKNLRNKVFKLLWDNKEVLAESNVEVGMCPLYKPNIPLDTNEPIYTPQYMVPYQMREEMRKSVKEFLKMKIIKPSVSPYNSPSLMVPKKDGGFRLVVDFRRLNKHVITDPHPLPRITQIMESLGKTSVFSVLDLLHGFYNLEIDPIDRPKTAFSTFDGHWEFLRLPMGLKNSPAIFQRLMQIVLSGCLGHYAFIYIDDILIYSKNAEEHIEHLKQIFERLKKAGLKIKGSKCQLFKNEVEYLGFLAGQDGLKVNPRKLNAIQHFPTPTTVKEIQSFLGLANYFRSFIVGFSEKAKPLNKLLHKDTPFKWTKEHENAISQLKYDLTHAPVLAFPNFNDPFLLTTDASGYAIGAILTQIQEGKERLIACNSRVLTLTEQRYSNTDRETLAVIYGINTFRSYLWNNKFIVYTDNTAITAIANQDKSTNRRAMRWYIILSEYQFDMRHRPASTMQHADALSRNPKQKKSEHLYNLSADVPSSFYLSPSLQSEEFIPIFDLNLWREAMKDVTLPDLTDDQYEYTQDDKLIYRQLKTETSPIQLDLTNDEKQLWVPPSLRQHVLELAHDTPAAGHQGAKKMISALKQSVWWQGMNKDIYLYCQECIKCQMFKHHAHRTPLAGRPPPRRCLEEISMDVVGPVPSSSRGTKYILCIQDRLSRFLVFAPMKNQNADTTARTFISTWICQFGAPKRIITDQGRNFISETFQALCKFLGTKHSPTTAYRPQANAENERSHKDLHSYIAMYLNSANALNWDLLLQHAAWVHNSTIHQILQKSPFEILTGLKPRQPYALLSKQPDLEITTEEYFNSRTDQIADLAKEAKLAIEKSQAKTQERSNIFKKATIYQQGQLVWSRTHPLKLIGKKWGEKYDGPYVVTEVVSPQVVQIAPKTNISQKYYVHTSYIRPYQPTKLEKLEKCSEKEEPSPLKFSDLEETQEPQYQFQETIIEDPVSQDSLYESIENKETFYKTSANNEEKVLSPVSQLVESFRNLSTSEDPTKTPARLNRESTFSKVLKYTDSSPFLLPGSPSLATGTGPSTSTPETRTQSTINLKPQNKSGRWNVSSKERTKPEQVLPPDSLATEFPPRVVESSPSVTVNKPSVSSHQDATLFKPVDRKNFSDENTPLHDSHPGDAAVDEHKQVTNEQEKRKLKPSIKSKTKNMFARLRREVGLDKKPGFAPSGSQSFAKLETLKISGPVTRRGLKRREEIENLEKENERLERLKTLRHRGPRPKPSVEVQNSDDSASE